LIRFGGARKDLPSIAPSMVIVEEIFLGDVPPERSPAANVAALCCTLRRSS
jgi:hypothetical protein